MTRHPHRKLAPGPRRGRVRAVVTAIVARLGALHRHGRVRRRHRPLVLGDRAGPEGRRRRGPRRRDLHAQRPGQRDDHRDRRRPPRTATRTPGPARSRWWSATSRASSRSRSRSTHRQHLRRASWASTRPRSCAARSPTTPRPRRWAARATPSATSRRASRHRRRSPRARPSRPPPFPNCSSQPNFWAAIEGPNTDKVQGDRLHDPTCSGPRRRHHLRVLGRQQHRVPPRRLLLGGPRRAPGGRTPRSHVQVYDPAFVLHPDRLRRSLLARLACRTT